MYFVVVVLMEINAYSMYSRRQLKTTYKVLSLISAVHNKLPTGRPL